MTSVSERTSGGAGLTETRASALADSQLARELGAGALEGIADQIRLIDLEPGQVLVAEGDVAEELFVVLDGELEVLVDASGVDQSLSRIRPGETVGEIALLAGDHRSATVRALVPSALAAITADGFQRLLRDRPAEAEGFARRAVERLRHTQLVRQLNDLFGALEPEVLATIEDLIEWMPVRAGTRLFQEGDPGDAGYLVVTGRLRAFRTVDGAEVEVGEIGRSQMAGEIALLEDVPRTATVYAVRDSQLVRFSRAAFTTLIERYPSAGLLVARTVLERARGDHRPGRPTRLSFVVVPGSPGVDVSGFVDELGATLGARRVSSTAIDEELGLPDIAQLGDDDVGAIRLAYHLEELQERHRFLLYEIDDEWTSWSRRALRWADHVIVVADAGASPEPSDLEQQLWQLVEAQKHPKVSLALVHPADTTLPSGTRRWLEPRSLWSHHHLRRGDDADMGRLARLLTGEATSLVLGGGGARGFAHLGVLVVLEELGVPIDSIGGASIGSIMAIGPALGWTAEEARQISVEQFDDLFDYTLPTVSLLKGDRITTKLRRTIGDVDIADLWIPYFCVSTNLTRAGARYHDRGPLVEAIRASIAIPGVLPPVPDGDELLVDGGVLDNVPVDEMRRRNPTGQVVAVDVAPADGPAADHDYGLSVSGFAALLGRRRGGGPPGLLTTMVRSMLIASVRDRDRVVRDEVADLYLDVEVEGGGLLEFGAAAHIASSAELTSRPVLRRWATRSGTDHEGYVRTTASAGSVLSDVRRRRRGFSVLLLTVRDLQHRAVRFAAVIAGTAVVLALLFLMTGLIEQFHREPERTVDALGAEAWMVRDGVSGAFTAASTLPADLADDVDGADASPVVVARHSITGDAEQTDVVVIGYEPGQIGEPELDQGVLPNGVDEVLVDESSGASRGDDIVIGDRTYSVTGTTDRTTMFAGMPLVFMDIESAQELVYRGQPLATAVLLDSANASVPDGFAVRTPDEIATDGVRPLDGAISSINMIRILLWFVAAMIIGTMVYLSALERRRDVAVLKAVGGSTRQMAASIALQGAATALVAALIASGLQFLLVPVFPLEVTVPANAFWQVPLIAVLVSLVAGGVGLRKAVRVDPALAFSGPGA